MAKACKKAGKRRPAIIRYGANNRRKRYQKIKKKTTKIARKASDSSTVLSGNQKNRMTFARERKKCNTILRASAQWMNALYLQYKVRRIALLHFKGRGGHTPEDKTK